MFLPDEFWSLFALDDGPSLAWSFAPVVVVLILPAVVLLVGVLIEAVCEVVACLRP